MIPAAEQLAELWQKPTFQELLECLRKLRQEPPVWNSKTSHLDILKEQESSPLYKREVTTYISSIIKSSLAWIEDDNQKEEIWTEASKRMSERCGRAAMGEITRRWPFESDEYPPFELIIREPPLTGDSLGLKTWGSSYLLAQNLHHFASQSLSHLFQPTGDSAGITVLELGSGTGILGLAAAYVWKTSVILTDLPMIMDNLGHNVEINRATIEAHGGHVEAAALTWGGSEDEIDQRFHGHNGFQCVVVADPLYDDDHPGLLASAIGEQLSLNQEARVIVMVPLRDTHTRRMLSEFRDNMANQSVSLRCIKEDILLGEDDWDADDEARNVQCWWGVFQRQCVK